MSLGIDANWSKQKSSYHLFSPSMLDGLKCHLPFDHLFLDKLSMRCHFNTESFLLFVELDTKMGSSDNNRMPAQMDFRWWSSCLGICVPIPWSAHIRVCLNNQCVSLHRISLNMFVLQNTRCFQCLVMARGHSFKGQCTTVYQQELTAHVHLY